MKKSLVFIFPLAIIIGTVFTNFTGIGVVRKWDIFSACYVDKVISVNLNFASALWYILKKRMIMFTVVILASLTKYKKIAGYMISSYLGFSFGLIISALTMQYGMKALLVFVVCILSYFIMYIFAICIIFLKAANMKRYILSFTAIVLGMLVETIITVNVLPLIVLILI